MKTLNLFCSSLFLGILTIFNFGCTDTCETTSSYRYFEPVYTSLETIRSSVEVVAGKDIRQSGKIYFINDYLLVNEPGEGIHIINNQDPANPVNEGFLKIPGNYDMAAIDGYLYADSYIDLVVFDISDITNPVEVKRIEEIFPNYNFYNYGVTEQGIVTDYVEVEREEQIDLECDEQAQYYYWGYYRYDNVIAMDAAAEAPSSNNSGGVAGIGGSMAKFTINNDHLFMIDYQDMHIVDISDPVQPMLGAKLNVGWGIETIFPFDSLIFIGANDGMYIYDVSSPLNPGLLSNYEHMTSCDPVVTDGRYAYVTLRSGNTCQGFSNQLEVIDIKDPSDPQLLETYPMYNPHGLSISDGKLFICDGEAGLKIYDAADIHSISDNLIKNYGDIHAYDVIVKDCLVMLIGDDGLFQYNCNDFQDEIIPMSVIPFVAGND